MKLRKLLGSALLVGMVAFPTSACSSGSMTNEEANKKIENATEKTQLKLKEELNKDILYFEAFMDMNFTAEVEQTYGTYTVNSNTGKEISREIIGKATITEEMNYSAEILGNLDTKYYKTYSQYGTDVNDSQLFVSVEQSELHKLNQTYEGENYKEEEKYSQKMGFEVRNGLARVAIDNLEDLEETTIPVAVDYEIATYYNYILEMLETPVTETVDYSLEDILLMAAYESGEDDVIAMVHYLVETYDLENLSSEDIIDIIMSFVGENDMLTPSIKSYLVSCLDDIKKINTDKIVEIKEEKEGKYNFVKYSLNYKELKSYINKVIDVFNKKLNSLSGDEKVMMSTLVTYLDEYIKQYLPQSVNISFGLGLKDGTVRALSVDFGLKGFTQKQESLYDFDGENLIGEYSTATIKNLSMSFDIGYDFANAALSVPTLEAYFK